MFSLITCFYYLEKIQNDTGAANLSMLTLSQLLQTMPGNKTSKVANKKKGFSKQSTVKEKQLPIVDIKVKISLRDLIKSFRL